MLPWFHEMPLEMLCLLLHNIRALFLMIGEDTTAEKVISGLFLFWIQFGINPTAVILIL
jgi:hypothetical protein